MQRVGVRCLWRSVTKSPRTTSRCLQRRVSSTFCTKAQPNKWLSQSPGATIRVGALLVQSARSGDAVCFHGDLGSGKSVLARGMIRALVGDPKLGVASPTFLLDITYPTETATVHHFDLYRLSGPDDFDGLGIEDALKDDICLFEWPDRLAEMMPAERLDVFMEHGELNEDGEDSGERLMTLLPHGRDWERRVAGALERCIQQDLLVSVEDNTG